MQTVFLSQCVPKQYAVGECNYANEPVSSTHISTNQSGIQYRSSLHFTINKNNILEMSKVWQEPCHTPSYAHLRFEFINADEC